MASTSETGPQPWLDHTPLVEPFLLDVPEEQLTALRERLATTRWPEAETVEDWSQGVPIVRLRALTDHWLHHYDWRRCETLLNSFGQFRTKIDGLTIHFLHIRSPHPAALPLIITHGWPGSVIEFHKVIAPLTDPVAHGGSAEDAFHLVLPSLPGYGFSDKPRRTGWSCERIAAAWDVLMRRLGYNDYVAQGGDWGAAVTTALARIMPPSLRAIHLNMVLAASPRDPSKLDDAGREALAAMKAHQRTGAGYAALQATKPQTIGYALADSPIGQAAWIYEKFHDWTDCDDDPESIFSRDELIDNIMLYWLPSTGASAARLYWESYASGLHPEPVHVPTGCTIFPRELRRPPRSWAEKTFANLVYWNEAERGGHFAAFEQPEIFVREVRDAFRATR